MRKHDKLKNITVANLLMEKLYLQTKPVKGILYEDFKMLLKEEDILGVNKVVSSIEKAGADINDKDVQLAFLDNFIDSDFNLSKINPQKVVKDADTQNYGETLNENAGAYDIKHLLHLAHELLDGVETGEVLAHKISHSTKGKVTKQIIKKGLSLLEKMINFAPNIIGKAIYKLMMWGGSSLESAKIGSMTGPIIWICVLVGVSLVSFPSLLSGATGVWGITYFLYKTWGIIKGIFDIVKNIFKTKEEHSDELMTITDVLDGLHKNNIDMDHDEVKIADEWYHKSMGTSNKNNVNKTMSYMVNAINNRKWKDTQRKFFQLKNKFGFPQDIADKLVLSINNFK